MRQSQLFSKSTKDVAKDEESINAQLLIRGGYVDKLMAGVYSFLPLGWRVIQKIETIVREEIAAVGGQELLLPALQPKQLWEKTGRWTTLDVLYRLADDGVAFGPTHEEVVTPLAKRFIHSYKDLPKQVYQIQTKFRHEPRAKSGLLRGREFIMKDLYSFHATSEDLDVYHEAVRLAYGKIYQRLGLGELTHYTYASGGTFAKYSHEFQTITPAGEDTIHVCQGCQQAVNEEIKGETTNCPNCQGTDWLATQASEVGNIFKLQTKFSEPFELTYQTATGKLQPVVMGCYGLGISRLMGVLVEVFHDERGIVWPAAVAPYQVHLLALGEEAAGAERAEKELTAAGIEVLFDDRPDVSAGQKLKESDLLGLPVRLVISNKVAAGQVEYKLRASDQAEQLTIKEAIKRLTL
ncbi:MAG: aminoacyl--tRNA ligase-related protein [Patescibacteria group bacterium]